MRGLPQVVGLWLLIGIGVAFVSVSQSQSLGKGRPVSRPANQSSGAFVTRTEASKALSHVRAVVYRVVLRKPPPAQPIVIKSAICSRKELVDVLFEWFRASETEFKVTPIPAEYDRSLLSIPVADPSRKKLEALVSWGFVGRVDPLATGGKAGLSTAEFGDAIGYFLCRLSDLTHMPSSKFSPAMMGGG